MPLCAFAFRARESIFVLRQCWPGQRIIEVVDECVIYHGGTFPAYRHSIACYEFAAVSRNRVRRSISLAPSDDRLPPGSLRPPPSRPEAYRATALPSRDDLHTLGCGICPGHVSSTVGRRL